MQGKTGALFSRGGLQGLGTFHNAGSDLPTELIDLFDQLALAMFEANVGPLSRAWNQLGRYLAVHPEYLDRSVGGHGTVREFFEEAESIINEMLASPHPSERRGGLSGLSGFGDLGAPPWQRNGPPTDEITFLRLLQQFARAMKESAEALLASDLARSHSAGERREEAAERMLNILRGVPQSERERFLRHIANDTIRDRFRAAANGFSF